MSHLTPIYAVWEHNAEAMASDIGELGVTVRQWRNRGNIPPQYWPKIIEAAAQRGATLEWHQFVPPIDDSRPLPAPGGATTEAETPHERSAA